MRAASSIRWLTGLAGLAALALLAGWPAPARAQSVYTVNDLPMDATAADAVAAREQAITAAQREGLRRLWAELAGEGGTKLPDAATVPIERYVRSFEIAREQMGAKRYTGRLNVTYAGERVRDALGKVGVTPAKPAVPTLVVPAVATPAGVGLWWEAEAWSAALAQAVSGETKLKLQLPLGDAPDIAGLTPAQAATGDPAALRALAQRYAASEVVLAVLQGEPASPTGVELRSGAGGTTRPAVPGGATLDQAAQAVIAALRAGAGGRGAPAAAALRLEVELPLTDLGQWRTLRRALEEAPAVRSLRLETFARRAAEVTLSYTGEVAALQEDLRGRGLDLRQEEGRWRLVEDLAASPSPPADVATTPLPPL